MVVRSSDSSSTAPAVIKQAFARIPGARPLWRLLRYRLPRLLGWQNVPDDQPIPPPVSRPSDRGPVPVAGRAALAAGYQRSTLAGEPETFVLYRIIGNDL